MVCESPGGNCRRQPFEYAWLQGVRAQVFFDEGCIFGEEGQGFERSNLACPKWVLKKALERLVKIYREEFQI